MIRAKDVLLRFLAVLDASGIPYAIGGSLASGLHGEPRTTHDFDLLVELSSDQMRPLGDALSPDYVDVPSMREALERRRSFNVIHRGSAQKIESSSRRTRPWTASRWTAAWRRASSPAFPRSSSPRPRSSCCASWTGIAAGETRASASCPTSPPPFASNADGLDWGLLERLARELDLHDLLERVRSGAP